MNAHRLFTFTYERICGSEVTFDLDAMMPK